MSLIASLSLLLSFTILLIFSTVTTADNITLAFEKHSSFSTMSNLFIKTKLTEPISNCYTITILAVSNEAITSIINKSDVEIKNILMTHVILDYYDDLKFQEMTEKTKILTTLYQTTGLGVEMNGFMNITKSKGRVYFGSGVKNSPLTSEYVKTVYQNPYNLSIIQISKPIVAPGLSFETYKSPPPPPHVHLVQSPSHMNARTASGSDTLEADSPTAPRADNQKTEAHDNKVGPSSACNTSWSFGVILLLVSLASFVGF